MKPSKSHPHLWGAVTRLTADSKSKGACFWRAAGFVLDVPTAVLTVGILRAATPEELAKEPELSQGPFFHAWCEWKGYVIAPTTVERLGGLHRIDRLGYYATNGASDIRHMSRPHLLRVSQEIGLGRMLMGRQDRTSEPWGIRLLDELGYSWRVTDCGGMVPA